MRFYVVPVNLRAHQGCRQPPGHALSLTTQTIFQAPQQAVQMQGTLQNPVVFHNSLPPQSTVHFAIAQTGFSTQIQNELSLLAGMANELLENVRMVKQEIGKLSLH